MHIEHYPDYIDKFEDALMKIKAPKSTLGYAAAGAVGILSSIYLGIDYLKARHAYKEQLDKIKKEPETKVY